CPDYAICRNGNCVHDGCREIRCPEGQQCEDEQCIEGVDPMDPCAGINCPAGQFCERGLCIDPLCEGISCDPGTVCSMGICELSADAAVEAGVDMRPADLDSGPPPGSEADPTDPDGCDCDAGGGGGPSWLLVLLPLWAIRRRRTI
ncbi:MAG: SYNERG-CTERM sorting domain-containing protein, partial [Myxococcales bacterium]|nr:SYNERG-CTERM sorting domain-containing protein [Myxococcales bacterium]